MAHHFKQNEQTVTDSLLIAENIDEYFVKVGPNLAKEIPTLHNSFRNFVKQRCSASVFLDPVTDDEVFNEIKQLNVNTSSGQVLMISLQKLSKLFLVIS